MKKSATFIYAMFLVLGAHAQQLLETTVHFDFAKYELRQDAKDILTRLKNKIPAGKTVEVYIYGHTDGVGGPGYNLWLGQRRANTVKQFLADEGIEDSMIFTGSYGKFRPVSTNTTSGGRASNREVDIEFCLTDKAPAKSVITEQASEIKKATATIAPLPVQTDAVSIERKDSGIAMTYKGGTIVNITPTVFGSNDMNKVKLEVNEILTTDDMIENHATTEDKEGMSLVSGGMVTISATVNGKEINAATPYTVDIPVDDYAIDSAMELFVCVKRNGYLVWQETRVPVKVVQKDNKYYYEFTVSSFGGFNCDKYRKYNVATANTPHPFDARNMVVVHHVRIKTAGYKIEDAYVVDKKTGQMVPGKISRTKTVIKFTYQTTKKSDFKLYVKANRNGRTYYAINSMKLLNQKRLSHTYLLEPFRFRPITARLQTKYFAEK